MLDKISRKQYNILILILGAFLFVPFLGQVHLFDWDEINFAEAAREMILLDDYWRVHIDFKPFWEKPPFFIWLQAASMHIFGINEFAARLPNALVGITTLLVLFNIGYTMNGKAFGVFWVLCYVGSFLPHFYFKSGIIDPTFNLFIFLGIHSIIKHISSGKRHISGQLILAGLFTGLAVLTKGPVGYLIIILTMFAIRVFAWIQKRSLQFSWISFVLFSLIALAVSGLWFGVELVNNGIWFFEEFITYQIRLLRTGDAGHSGPFFFHWYILLIGCFPASVFALQMILRSFRLNPRLKKIRMPMTYDSWMHILFWVVLILFSVVKTKIVHYSSLCYFPLTYLAASYLTRYLADLERWRKNINTWLIIIASIIASGMAVIVTIGKYTDSLVSMIKDPFVIANLEADVNWTGYEYLIPLLLLIMVIVSVNYYKKKRFLVATVTLFSSNVIVLQLFILVFASKIERYTQHAAVEFFKSTQGEKCEVEVVGYRSYANLFYTQKQPLDSIEIKYYVTRIDRLKAMESRKHINVKELYRKNGFIFYAEE